MSDHPRVLLLPVVRKITFQLVYYQLYVLPHDSAYNAPCLCTWIRGHMQVHCVLMMDLSNLQSLCSIQLKKMLGSSGEWSSDINYSIYVFFFFFTVFYLFSSQHVTYQCFDMNLLHHIWKLEVYISLGTWHCWCMARTCGKFHKLYLYLL